MWSSINPLKPKSDGRITTRGPYRRKEKTKEQKNDLIKESKQIEERIAKLENEKSDLESRINDAFSGSEHKKVRDLSVNLEKVNKHLERFYSQWEKVAGYC